MLLAEGGALDPRDLVARRAVERALVLARAAVDAVEFLVAGLDRVLAAPAEDQVVAAAAVDPVVAGIPADDVVAGGADEPFVPFRPLRLQVALW
jgi:hypothetical protein